MHVPAIGRIVHYQPTNGLPERPAMIVHVWSPGDAGSAVQLQVFYDTDTDGQHNDGHNPGITGPVGWETSVTQGLEPGEYHFHEECPARSA